MSTLTTSENGFTLIKFYEGKQTLWSVQPELVSYLCPAHRWTIGYGTIIYPDGTPVREGDRCSVQQARRWMINDVRAVEQEIHAILYRFNMTGRIGQHQFDSLVDIGYNVGTGQNGLGGSTLIKHIAANASPDAIDADFMMWCKGRADRDGKDNDGDGLIDEPGEKKMLLGLLTRRRSDAWLFRYGELRFFLR